ncbi:hypothetical protein THASP1DRAFT_28960 [Thamnocephalis sphaerospora]|uniref:Uncharacterized protein n=1 Tax=Thamnocephalis sphaerospora TaxID=78915 RepID=A0A4P9XSY0_9FUNG|nr:hypothetical protein THASP1DRAFT_28960 [Thamnocephalis sphaerospora]|eukprot:RKP09254.1 hypothetical protein THASP1DRAFT_28960 [Thamnocephalis sphaerospora]
MFNVLSDTNRLRYRSLSVCLENLHRSVRLRQLHYTLASGECKSPPAVFLKPNATATAEFTSSILGTSTCGALAYKLATVLANDETASPAANVGHPAAASQQRQPTWLVIAWDVLVGDRDGFTVHLVETTDDTGSHAMSNETLATLLDRLCVSTAHTRNASDTRLPGVPPMHRTNVVLQNSYMLEDGLCFTIHATMSNVRSAELRISLYEESFESSTVQLTDPIPLTTLLATSQPPKRLPLAPIPVIPSIGTHQLMDIPPLSLRSAAKNTARPVQLSQPSQTGRVTDKSSVRRHQDLTLVLHNRSTEIQFTNPILHSPHANCSPSPPDNLSPNASFSMKTAPQPDVCNCGVLLYRIAIRRPGAEPEPSPGYYLAVAWKLSRNPSDWLVDIVQLDPALDKQKAQTVVAKQMFGLLGAELHRGGSGRPRWKGCLMARGRGLVVCELQAHVTSEAAGRVDIALRTHTASVSSMPRTLPPPLWIPAVGFRHATVPGILAVKQALQYINDNRRKAVNAANDKGTKFTPAIVLVENQIPSLCLRRYAIDESLSYNIAFDGENPKNIANALSSGQTEDAPMIMPCEAEALATLNQQTQHILSGYCIYQLENTNAKKDEHASLARSLTLGQGSVPNSPAENILAQVRSGDFLLVSWTPTEAQKSAYSVELMQASTSFSVASPSWQCAMLLINALGLAVRGQCVVRTSPPGPSRIGQPTTSSITKETTLAVGYYSLTKIPVISVDLTMPGLITKATGEPLLPNVRIVVENAHAKLVLTNAQTYTISCVPIDADVRLRASIGYGGTRIFQYGAASLRQIGVLTFDLQTAQQSGPTSCLVLAWRQSAEFGRDFFVYSNVMQEDDSKQGANTLSVVNVYSRVFNQKDSVFIQQMDGVLASNASLHYAIATSIRHVTRGRQNEEGVEITVRLTDDVPTCNEEVQQRDGQDLHELQVQVQNLHSGLQLADIRLFLTAGKEVQKPQSTARPGKIALARIQPAGHDASTAMSGLLLAKFVGMSGESLDGDAYFIAGWTVSETTDTAETRQFFAQPLASLPSPMESLEKGDIVPESLLDQMLQQAHSAGEQAQQHHVLSSDLPDALIQMTMNPQGPPKLEIVIRSSSNTSSRKPIMPSRFSSLGPKSLRRATTIKSMAPSVMTTTESIYIVAGDEEDEYLPEDGVWSDDDCVNLLPTSDINRRHASIIPGSPLFNFGALPEPSNDAGDSSGSAKSSSASEITKIRTDTKGQESSADGAHLLAAVPLPAEKDHTVGGEKGGRSSALHNLEASDAALYLLLDSTNLLEPAPLARSSSDGPSTSSVSLDRFSSENSVSIASRVNSVTVEIADAVADASLLCIGSYPALGHAIELQADSTTANTSKWMLAPDNCQQSDISYVYRLTPTATYDSSGTLLPSPVMLVMRIRAEDSTGNSVQSKTFQFGAVLLQKHAILDPEHADYVKRVHATNVQCVVVSENHKQCFELDATRSLLIDAQTTIASSQESGSTDLLRITLRTVASASGLPPTPPNAANLAALHRIMSPPQQLGRTTVQLTVYNNHPMIVLRPVAALASSPHSTAVSTIHPRHSITVPLVLPQPSTNDVGLSGKPAAVKEALTLCTLHWPDGQPLSAPLERLHIGRQPRQVSNTASLADVWDVWLGAMQNTTSIGTAAAPSHGQCVRREYAFAATPDTRLVVGIAWSPPTAAWSSASVAVMLSHWQT